MFLMKNQATRYETNQKIKRLLVTHNTDLSRLFYSFSGKSATFSGRLIKTSGSGMKIEEVETLCQSLSAIAEVQFLNFDLDNWSISSGAGSFEISKKADVSSGPSKEQKPLIINTPEMVQDVLRDHFGRES